MSANGNTSSSVRNQRAPQLVETDDAQRALWRRLDWFATPPWATRAGAEIIKQIDPSAREVWEPAAGDGIMGRVLAESFEHVHMSDCHVQREGIEAFDFTRPVPPPFACDWIITNPPFILAKQFTERALEHAHMGVAMLCRLNWLESAERFSLFEGAQKLGWLFPFSERVPMQLGPWDPECSSATAYAWFMWAKTPIAQHAVTWRGRLIAPGTRSRLTRPDDIRKYCAAAAAPLLSAGDQAGGETGEAK